jgi:hypothetical protein
MRQELQSKPLVARSNREENRQANRRKDESNNRFAKPILPLFVAAGLLLLPDFGEEASQVGLKRLFGRRLSIRSEPVFEVLDSNLVLDLRLPDGNCNC